MAISYNRLWKLLIDKELKKTDLVKLAGISSNVVASLGQNKSVSLDSLEKICISLDCNIGDIMEFTLQKREIKGDMEDIYDR